MLSDKFDRIQYIEYQDAKRIIDKILQIEAGSPDLTPPPASLRSSQPELTDQVATMIEGMVPSVFRDSASPQPVAMPEPVEVENIQTDDSLSKKLKQIEEELNCPIELERIKKPVVLGCSHVFEQSAIKKALYTNCNCPICKAECSPTAARHVNTVMADVIESFSTVKSVETYHEFIESLKISNESFAAQHFTDHLATYKQYAESLSDEQQKEAMLTFYQQMYLEERQGYDKSNVKAIEAIQSFAKEVIDILNIQMGSAAEIRAYCFAHPEENLDIAVASDADWESEAWVDLFRRRRLEAFADKINQNPLSRYLLKPCLAILLGLVFTTIKTLLYTVGWLVAGPFLGVFACGILVGGLYKFAKVDRGFNGRMIAPIVAMVALLPTLATAYVGGAVFAFLQAIKEGLTLGAVMAEVLPIARMRGMDKRLLAHRPIFQARVHRELREGIVLHALNLHKEAAKSKTKPEEFVSINLNDAAGPSTIEETLPLKPKPNL